MALLGRSAEQEVLSRLLASARLGRGGRLVIVGEPGVGKTALVQDALADPVAGGAVRVLTATGAEAEQDLPFAALHACLLPALHLLESIPAPQADGLGAALNLRPGHGRDRFAIGAATLSLLSRFAEGGPVVLVLDDVQWMDLPSVEALAFAARRIADDPVAVLAAGRPDGLPPPLQSAPRLEIHGLVPAAAARLVTEAVPSVRDATALQRLYQVTGGNPLALLELAGAPEAAEAEERPPTLPGRLQSAFARRLRPLTEEERTAALVVAVAGEDLRLVRAVCTVLEVDPGGVVAVAGHGLLTVVGDRVRFPHPLLRSAVYGAAQADLRRRVHRAVAGLLTGTADADRRVWHLVAGTEQLDEQVAAELVELAARASTRTAFSVAATALERAARLSPDLGRARLRLVSAAESAWAAGDRSRALRLLDEAEPAGAVVTPAGAELRAAVAVRSGSLREGERRLEEAAARAGPDDAVILLADACHACMYLADSVSLRRVRTDLSQTLPQVADPLARAVGMAAAGAAGLLLGVDAAAQLRAALPLLAEHADPLALPAVVPWLGLAPLFLRDAEAGAELWELVQVVRTRVGPGLLPNLLFHVARDQATSTQWRRAAANYAEAVALARETGQSTELAMALAGLACLDARAGRHQDCRAHVAEALTLCRDRSLHFGEIWCDLALGDVALAEGEVQAAADRLATLDQRLADLGVADPDLHPGPELVDALCRVGRAGEAAAVAERFAQLARATGRPWTAARAARGLALVADPEEGFDEPFRSALAHHRRTRDVFETARTHLAYGMRLRRAGRRLDARTQLRAAVEIFDDLGAGRWAANARTELVATGEKVPPRPPIGPASLTPQELGVCVLLAEGRTTREAAAALFLSPKTIEYHLRKAYTKLGVHTRAELAEQVGAPARRPGPSEGGGADQR